MNSSSKQLLRYYQSFVPKHLPATETDVEQLQSFLKKSHKLFVITGAGLSTESGIPDYRSPTTGVYTRLNSNTPMTLQQFLGSHRARQRYWARNYLAWPYFSSRKPNIGHKVIHAMDKHCLVTQNVDGLHRKAGSADAIELHGCGYTVNCLQCKETIGRDEYQVRIAEVNTDFDGIQKVFGDVRPDGDVYIDETHVDSFKIPECEHCNSSMLQPNIIFFGANVPRSKVDNIYGKLEDCDSMLVVGSSLQVFSAYRFVLRAAELQMPICILTVGETRGDKLAGLKIDRRISDVLSNIKL